MNTAALPDRRLRHLYEISTLLTRFAGVDATLPSVIEVAARALPVRTAAIVLDTDAGLQSHVWKTPAVDERRMDAILAHARESYSWFAAGSALVDRVSPPPSVRPLPNAEGDVPASKRAAPPSHFVVLPLVVERARVFGVLQMESVSALEESDVFFVNAVANQIAVAIDRQMAIDAAEARVRAQLELTRAITSSVGEGIVATDANARITFVNPAAEQMLAVSARQVAGKPAAEILRVRSADAQAIVECPLVRTLRTGGRVVSDDHAFATRSDTVLPVSYIAAPIVDAGRITGGVLAFRDVLAVKRSERAQRLLADCSAALGETLDPPHMLGALVRRVVPSFADAAFVDLADAQDRMTRVASAGAEHTQDDDVSTVVVPLRASGRSLGMLTFAMNVGRTSYSTDDRALAEEIGRRASIAFEHARLQAETEKAVRARDDVLAVVSHDMRSPLGTVLMAVGSFRDRIRERESDPEDLRTIEIIARAADRMLRLTRDLLDVSSIEANRLAIDAKPTRVASMMRELADALGPTAKRRSLELVVSEPEAGVFATCDHDRILQVLTNLVGNAIKFTPAGGRIDVLVTASDDAVCFMVRDSGRGISAELLPHVFERSRQAPETASQGRGLGLFIAKGIVEAHGGHIRVASERGVGTTFEFSLPRAHTTLAKTTADREDGESHITMRSRVARAG